LETRTDGATEPYTQVPVENKQLQHIQVNRILSCFDILDQGQPRISDPRRRNEQRLYRTPQAIPESIEEPIDPGLMTNSKKISKPQHDFHSQSTSATTKNFSHMNSSNRKSDSFVHNRPFVTNENIHPNNQQKQRYSYGSQGAAGSQNPILIDEEEEPSDKPRKTPFSEIIQTLQQQDKNLTEGPNFSQLASKSDKNMKTNSNGKFEEQKNIDGSDQMNLLVSLIQSKFMSQKNTDTKSNTSKSDTIYNTPIGNTSLDASGQSRARKILPQGIDLQPMRIEVSNQKPFQSGKRTINEEDDEFFDAKEGNWDNHSVRGSEIQDEQTQRTIESILGKTPTSESSTKTLRRYPSNTPTPNPPRNFNTNMNMNNNGYRMNGAYQNNIHPNPNFIPQPPKTLPPQQNASPTAWQPENKMESEVKPVNGQFASYSFPKSQKDEIEEISSIDEEEEDDDEEDEGEVEGEEGGLDEEEVSTKEQGADKDEDEYDEDESTITEETRASTATPIHQEQKPITPFIHQRAIQHIPQPPPQHLKPKMELNNTQVTIPVVATGDQVQLQIPPNINPNIMGTLQVLQQVLSQNAGGQLLQQQYNNRNQSNYGYNNMPMNNNHPNQRNNYNATNYNNAYINNNFAYSQQPQYPQYDKVPKQYSNSASQHNSYGSERSRNFDHNRSNPNYSAGAKRENFGSNNPNKKFLKKGRYNNEHNQTHNLKEEPLKTSENPEKLLGMSLSELGGSNEKPKDSITNFLERGNTNMANTNSEHTSNEEAKIEENWEPLYSDKLGLEEKYLSKIESPISKVFKHCVHSGENLPKDIGKNIDGFIENLKRKKEEFFYLLKEVQGIDPETYFDGIVVHEPSPKKQSATKSFIKAAPKKDDLIGTSMSIENHNLFHSFGNDDRGFRAVMNTNVSQSEITPEFIQATLESVWGDVQLTEDEMLCIQSIINRRPCVYRTSRPSTRSIIYQLTANLCSGLVIYIHSSYLHAIEEMNNIPKDLSLAAAAMNSIIMPDRFVITEQNIAKGDVKLLFITPESLMNLNLSILSEVAFICLAEGQIIPDNSSGHKSQALELFKFVKKTFPNTPILSLANYAPMDTCKTLCDTMGIGYNYLFPNYIGEGIEYPLEIVVTQDEDRFKALQSLFKKNDSWSYGTVIYTNNKKTAEEVSYYLKQIGKLSFPGYKSEKDLIDYLTTKSIGIIVATSSIDLGPYKSAIKTVIHFSLPKSLEIYIQEISKYNPKETQFRLFLHEEDYFRTRISFYHNRVELFQIEKLFEKMKDAQKEGQEEAMRMMIRKKDMQSRLQQNPVIGNIFAVDNIVKTKEHQAVVQQSVEMSKEFLYCIGASQLCQALDLKKETILQLFQLLEESGSWLEFCGVHPSICSVKIVSELGQKVALTYPVIKPILDVAKQDKGGVYTFKLVEVANELKWSIPQVLRELNL